MKLRIGYAPSQSVPTFLRNFLVWGQARRDAKFAWYACWEVIVRWLGKKVVWEPEDNPTHARMAANLELPEDYTRWSREREVVEKDLAKRPSFWVLVTFLVLCFLADILGNIQLLKSLGVDAGLRRVLMGFALASVMFALPLLAVKFAGTKKSRPWFWAVMALIGLIVIVIGTVQVGETSATSETSAQDIAAGLLLSVAVVGPALLSKFILIALFPVWQLRKERQRLRGMMVSAKRAQREAEVFCDRLALYDQWYDSQASQIASVYRRAFARRFLALHGDPERLRRMMLDDTPETRDAAMRDPLRITSDLVDPPSPAGPHRLDEPPNPYRRRP